MKNLSLIAPLFFCFALKAQDAGITIPDWATFCEKDSDCTSINNDCCIKNFIAVNTSQGISLKSEINAACRKLIKDDKEKQIAAMREAQKSYAEACAAEIKARKRGEPLKPCSAKLSPLDTKYICSGKQALPQKDPLVTCIDKVCKIK